MAKGKHPNQDFQLQALKTKKQEDGDAEGD